MTGVAQVPQQKSFTVYEWRGKQEEFYPGVCQSQPKTHPKKTRGNQRARRQALSLRSSCNWRSSSRRESSLPSDLGGVSVLRVCLGEAPGGRTQKELWNLGFSHYEQSKGHRYERNKNAMFGAPGIATRRKLLGTLEPCFFPPRGCLPGSCPDSMVGGESGLVEYRTAMPYCPTLRIKIHMSHVIQI